ncbi:MAG: OmpA family protein [Alphaproteobacteria bacterium]|nr:OmpA family protein [Alphaproteobacteria bacterium]
MNTSVKLMLAGAALLIGLGSSAAEAQILNVVRDSNGNTVRAALSGDCVRHNQEVAADFCGGCWSKAFFMGGESVSVYFDFNKAVLTADARQTLDAFVKSVKASGDKVTGVRVTGFADRIGTAAINERISKQRADAVRRYLLNKGVLRVHDVETVWFGDSQPATKCAKDLSRDALIKCLQPDRRVDVQIETKSVR